MKADPFGGIEANVSDARPHPYRAAGALALLAQTLFSYRLTIPTKPMFDETHYVPAARTLIALAGPTNIEHPLLAKEIIACGILLFGDTSLGWRFFSTLAGTGIVLGVFAILWMMLGRVRPAVFGGLFALFNGTVYVQARIGMLDGFMAAFAILGLAALLWAMRAPTGTGAWLRWILGAALLGLAVAAKWAAAPLIAFAAIGFVLLRLYDARRAGRSVFAALNAGGHRHWPGMAVVPAMLVLGAVSVTAYFATFAPAFFYTVDPLTFGSLLPFQQRMYDRQTLPLPPHPYQSAWWSWPIMVRPIWYLYERTDGAQRGVLLIGNLAVLWGGLIAVVACLYQGLRDRAPPLVAAGALWVGSYAMWVLIPKKIGFFYYYYLPSIALCIALAVAFDHFPAARRRDTAFLTVVIVLFAVFYPVLSAAPLPGPGAFRYWTWSSTWV
ncbi:MAG: phospholipid carrier-dependent glycosyltransferase [Sphingomonas sp.]|nr:MAG: phospholipid carrier-dependent glycosyltransferase [Sphingomonas sp.]